MCKTHFQVLIMAYTFTICVCDLLFFDERRDLSWRGRRSSKDQRAMCITYDERWRYVTSGNKTETSQGITRVVTKTKRTHESSLEPNTS